MNRSEILRRLSVMERRSFMSGTPYSFSDVRAALSWLVVLLMQRVCRNEAPAGHDHCGARRLVFLGTWRFSGAMQEVLMRRRNVHCSQHSTGGIRALACLITLLALCVPALGQETLPKHPDGEERKVDRISQELLSAPEPKLMMGGFASLRKWIDAWDVVPSEETKALGNASGAVCVTLRYGGRVVGRSVEVGGPDALERAARNVMKDALGFFGEKGKPKNAARIAISLEAAGALVPYQPSSYDDSDLEIPAGIDGVGARAGERDRERLRLVFPSMMLTFGHGADRTVGSGGQSPGDALAACAANVLEDPAVGIRSDSANDPSKLMRDRKVTFYRFEVTQLAQISPAEAPVFLFRQGKVFQERDVNVAAMKTWADGLANHLLSRISIHDKGALVSGLYSPISGACVPRAEIGEQALIGMALARAAQSGVLSAEAAAKSLEAARAIVRDLAVADSEKRKIETSPIASAALLLTVQALATEAPEAKGAIEAARREVRSVLEGPVRSPSVSALAAWAASGVEGKPELLAAAKSAVPAIFRAAPVEKLAAAMPWIVMAARSVEPDGEIASSVALDQWRDLVFKFVMRPQDAGTDGEDLVGGLVFTGSRAPLPSAQSLRVIAGLAAMLNDNRLTPPADRAAEIARLVPSLRFVRQLMSDEYTGTMFVDPLRAEWGVRNSLWDQRMSGEASALALITLCEAIEGAERGN